MAEVQVRPTQTEMDARYTKPIDNYITTGAMSSNTDDPILQKKVYQVYDVGPNPTLGSDAENLKASMISRYYKDGIDIPANFLWENFSKNSIRSKEEIIDMWETIYPELSKVYTKLHELRPVAALLRVTEQKDDEDERPLTLATFQYIDAIAAILGKVTGVKEIYRKLYRQPMYGIQKPKSTKHVDPKTIVTPTFTNVGKLPTWDDVTSHMSMVFHDPTLESSVKEYFKSPTKSITKNHQRMLRMMQTTMPIGSGYSFDQWLAALKLIYQTKELIGGVPSQQQQSYLRSPFGQYPERTPRLARYRD